MGFNIKNNYGPNIEVKEGGVVNLHQGKDGLWHTADVEEADYEEIKEDGTLQPAPSEEPRIDNSQERKEKLFRFVHPELEETEAWRIHDAVKRVVANYRVSDICAYLKELKQKGKLLLPSNPSQMYAELKRLGMPTGEGFSDKNFSNSYTK